MGTTNTTTNHNNTSSINDGGQRGADGYAHAAATAGDNPARISASSHSDVRYLGGAYGPRNALFVSGGGGLQRRDGEGAGVGGVGGGDGAGGGGRGVEPHWQQHWRNSPSRALLGEVSHGRFMDNTQLSEELSIDEWSVDSRSMDGQGAGGGGGRRRRRRGGRGGRRGSRFGDFDEEDGDEDDEEEMEEELEEDDDDSSMGGFVFDREGDGQGSGDGDNGTRLEVVEGSATAATAATAAAGNGGGGDAQCGTEKCGDDAEWANVPDDERRPSGSTAPASSYAADSCPDRNDTNSLHPSPGRGSECRSAENNGGIEACEDSRRPAAAAAAAAEVVEASAAMDGSGAQMGSNWDRDGGYAILQGEEEDEDGHADEERDSSSERDDDNDNDDDDSFNWDRARPLPPSANGYHQRARSTDAGTAIAATLAAEKLETAATGATVGGGDGDAGPAARGSPENSNCRPRGKSWPQNVAVRLREESSETTTTLQQEKQPRGGGGGGAISSQAASLRRDFRRQQGRGWVRGRRRGGGRGAEREVYDLWLYIQMQYCSHNNLQYFLEENPDRRAQTRVDMSQVN